ncbi:hypothetical protein A3F66_05275 [candidate division TM6 bacterium RIFCSPHIGHO2_12_FULL_32_22]|nr:MAG: hypothetical protein A3F66_05275 [candidate division TM6 bacterium RIFCSPHIGHO2_12_FULL_32_22]
MPHNLNIDKVVIWGYKLYSHTSSYVHYGFYKAFKELGFNVLWFDDSDITHNINFENSLFLTLGPDENIPLVKNSVYVLHNCFREKYANLKDSLVVNIQTLTQDCFKHNVKSLADWAFYRGNTLYLPWATDLLPDEIDEIMLDISLNWDKRKKDKDITFVGTIDGFFIVEPFLMGFVKESKNLGFSLKLINGWSQTLSVDDHIKIIRDSSIVPAIQGQWQCEKGYLPCRIFKNISYGKWGITNNYYAYKFFNEKITYDSDPKKLLVKAYDKIKTLKLEEQLDLMKFVRDNHTYFNRIEILFKFIDIVNSQ